MKRIIPKAKTSIKTIEGQRIFMDRLFTQLQYNSFEEWRTLKEKTIKEHQGIRLLNRYNSKMKELLQTVYPNYPWDFSKKRSELAAEQEREHLMLSLENQQSHMDKLYQKFKFKALKDWHSISKTVFKCKGGEQILSIYKDNYKHLLKAIYPNYPWKIENFKFLKSDDNFQTIEDQQEFIEEVYKNNKLEKMEDLMTLPKYKITTNRGIRLLAIYNNQLEKLFRTIYPNYPWHFPSTIIIEHRTIMDSIYRKYKLKEMSEWTKITHSKIRRNGGKEILELYENSRPKLLKAMYPYYPWKLVVFKKHEVIPYKILNTLEIQRNFMDQLYIRFQLNDLEDWMKVKKGQLLKFRFFEKVLNKNDFHTFLRSIYPNYPWGSIHTPVINKLKKLIIRYDIKEKKDWYRISVETKYYKYQLLHYLKKIYPSESWKLENFQLRSKKSTQRLLFACAKRIYPSFLIIENYHHPQLVFRKTHYELDLFIPALQLAMEYQGQHHYEDIPSSPYAFDCSQVRDQLKVQLAIDLAIKIVYIPYWWDQSLSSLRSTLPIKEFIICK